MSPPSLVFKVRRQDPELVSPADPTPRLLLPLSDIDDQEFLRFQMSDLQFYKNNPSMHEKDPVQVIRKALARALVFYYPFAGRLREGHGRKLSVDCTGEGIVFIEADADVALSDFGDFPQPPFPCLDELLFDVPGSDGIIGCPLLLIQVTRLKCSGFIFGIRFNHTMVDGQGIFQFMNAVGEMAHGALTPSIMPTWSRELFSARNPPRVTCIHPEYDEVEGTQIPRPFKVEKSYFFGKPEMSRLLRLVSQDVLPCTRFEMIAACLWRCRAIALDIDPKEEVRLSCVVSTRGNRNFNPSKLIGYYGNAIAFPVAVTTAEKLIGSSFGYVVELVKNTKGQVSEEYVQSTADLLATRGRPNLVQSGFVLVSDVTQIGFVDVDFGWGKAAYGGPPTSGVGPVPGPIVFFIACKNQKGEDGVVVPVCLPDGPAMNRFEKALNSMLSAQISRPMKSSM